MIAICPGCMSGQPAGANCPACGRYVPRGESGDAIGPYCGHDGRQCFRADKACLGAGQCLGPKPPPTPDERIAALAAARNAYRDTADLLFMSQRRELERYAALESRFNEARELVAELFAKYVTGFHGPRVCDCDASVGLPVCVPCKARAFLKGGNDEQNEGGEY